MPASRTFSPDRTDWLLLEELQADGRLSFNELSRRVHLSPPAVAERVRRLEQAGVIEGYTARVNRARVGQEILCFVEMRCQPQRCLLRTTAAENFPEVSEVHKLSGERCTLLRVHAHSLAHLEGIIERLGEHGELRTDITLSTPMSGRPVRELTTDRPVSRSQGWNERTGGRPAADRG